MAKNPIPENVRRSLPPKARTKHLTPPKPKAPEPELEPNPFEVSNRYAKAVKLFAPLFKAEVTRELAERMTTAEWGDRAREVGVNLPISAETREMVLKLLEENEWLHDNYKTRKAPCAKAPITWSWVKAPEVCVTLEKVKGKFVVRTYQNGKVSWESLPYHRESKARERFEGTVISVTKGQLLL